MHFDSKCTNSNAIMCVTFAIHVVSKPLVSIDQRVQLMHSPAYLFLTAAVVSSHQGEAVSHGLGQSSTGPALSGGPGGEQHGRHLWSCECKNIRDTNFHKISWIITNALASNLPAVFSNLKMKYCIYGVLCASGYSEPLSP